MLAAAPCGRLLRPRQRGVCRRHARRCRAAELRASAERLLYVDSADATVRQAARAARFSLLQHGQAPHADSDAPELRLDADGTLRDAAGERLGRSVRIRDAEDAAAVACLAGTEPMLLVEPEDGCWRVIPAENMVAAFASSRTRLLVRASSADDARLLFGALETGVDGVVLATDDAAEVALLQAHLRQLDLHLNMQPATVTRVVPVG